MRRKVSAKEELLEAVVIGVLIMAAVYFAAKHYSGAFEKCLKSGRSKERCHDILR